MSEQEAYIKSLFNEYQAALKKGSIDEILRTGELYFNSLHEGKMTQDERDKLQADVFYCALTKEKSK